LTREALPTAGRVMLGEEAPYLGAIAELARRHGLAGAARRYPDGACPVFAVGTEHVVKLFAPEHAGAADHERGVLEHLEGRLAVPTPVVRAAGAIDDWRYLVMSQLPGWTLRSAFPAMPRGDQLAIAAAAGRLVAELHGLALGPPGAIAARPDWPVILAERAERCVTHQAAHGAPADWLARIPAFLAGFTPSAARPEALLHTEIMREHLLVDVGPAGWRITGLVDFEPATIGPVEYELASVGLFFAEGDAELLRATLIAYGFTADQLDAGLRRRILAYALLHRESNLAWFLERLPPRPATTTFEQLADEWFAT
jgi:hygromycin-B 7''-O-kinase